MQEISSVGFPMGRFRNDSWLIWFIGKPISLFIYKYFCLYISICIYKCIYLSVICLSSVSTHIIHTFSLLSGGWGGWPCGLWGLSSRTKSWTWTLGRGNTKSLTTGLPGNFLVYFPEVLINWCKFMSMSSLVFLGLRELCSETAPLLSLPTPNTEVRPAPLSFRLS